MQIPTSTSGPTPRSRRWWATRLALASSSRICEPLLAILDGHRVRCRGRLLRDQFVQARTRVGSGGVVELDEQPDPFLLLQLVIPFRGLRDLFCRNCPSPPCLKMIWCGAMPRFPVRPRILCDPSQSWLILPDAFTIRAWCWLPR